MIKEIQDGPDKFLEISRRNSSENIRIYDCVQNYENLKSKFVEVFENVSIIKKINGDKKGETIVELETPFDSKILINFSLVLVKEGLSEDCYGKISFEKFIEGKDSDNFWYLFFDEKGRLRQELTDKERLTYSLQAKDCDWIIINALNKFIDKYLMFKISEVK
jgi:hypothetical protein